MKHRHISKRYWKDKTTSMAKSALIGAEIDDLINLSIGDPDLITHDLIIEGALRDAKLGHTKYTDYRGDPELRLEIIKFYKEEYDIDLEEDEVFVSSAASYGMSLVLQAILDDGDEVIVQRPCYTSYPYQVELARGVVVDFNTYEENGFQVDREYLESLITERTKAIIINTPSNPTGVCFDRHTLQDIADIAIKYDILILADDIYTEFSFQEPFYPIMKIPGMRERTVTVNSFSKNFMMTGWRIANIIAPPHILAAVIQINDHMMYSASSVSQRAAIHALRHRKEIIPDIVKEFKDRMFYAAERINKIPKISTIYPPQGAFYQFINIKETGLTSEEFSDKLLREAHILALPGNDFGDCGEGYIRIACTVGVDVLKEAFDRMGKLDFTK